MHLVVHIPFRPDDESARALSLARRAPSFTVEWVEDRKVAIAIYSSLPAGIDEAKRLIGEAVQLPGAWASMDSKRVSSLAKLWPRLSSIEKVWMPGMQCATAGESLRSSIRWSGAKSITALCPASLPAHPV